MEPRLRLAVHDARLQQEITEGILPHLPNGEVRLFTNGMGQKLPSSHMLIVCVSRLQQDPALSLIGVAQERDQPCGIIVRSEDRWTWSRLSKLHLRRNFRIVVACGGPREQLPGMFPHTLRVSDVHDLIRPGKEIAEHIWKVVEAETDRRSRDPGPISGAYAGNMGD